MINGLDDREQSRVEVVFQFRKEYHINGPFERVLYPRNRLHFVFVQGTFSKS